MAFLISVTKCKLPSSSTDAARPLSCYTLIYSVLMWQMVGFFPAYLAAILPSFNDTLAPWPRRKKPALDAPLQQMHWPGIAALLALTSVLGMCSGGMKCKATACHPGNTNLVLITECVNAGGMSALSHMKESRWMSYICLNANTHLADLVPICASS